jgi:transcriptional regulator with XRE-family HTH domain
MQQNTRTDKSRQRMELAEFLRARRDEVQPEDVGLARRGRRRVPGLRRNEVADLAAVSMTWYTWLEQGREIQVSTDVLDSVARALGLDKDGWRHLRRLAGSPVAEPPPPPPDAMPDLEHLVNDMLPCPALLTTGPYDLVAWNATYARLFGDPCDLPPSRRNSLWMFVVGSEARERLLEWKLGMEEIVEVFRAEAARYPGNARFDEVIAEVSAASEEFEKLWARQRVRRYIPHPLTMNHPEVGVIRMQLLQLRPVDQPSLLLAIYRYADEESRERLARLV